MKRNSDNFRSSLERVSSSMSIYIEEQNGKVLKNAANISLNGFVVYAGYPLSKFEEIQQVANATIEKIQISKDHLENGGRPFVMESMLISKKATRRETIVAVGSSSVVKAIYEELGLRPTPYGSFRGE